MSLRTFHIIFIVCSIVLSIGFGYWAINGYQQDHTLGLLWTGVGSFIVAIGLIIYEYQFIKKVKI